MHKYSFIMVANRLPVSVTKEAGKLSFQTSAGGLATAMSSIANKQKDTLWVGWPGIAAEELSDREKASIIKKLSSYNCYPIFLTSKEVEGFYDGYANDALWPLFHYFQSYANLKAASWETYRSVNERFATEIRGLATLDATIWVHDYHFMLLPLLIRQRVPAASIGFFLHIPFPNFEIFRLLPERQKILEGVLGADLIGFQTYAYAQYFGESTKRVLDASIKSGSIRYHDHMTLTDTFPISIDYEKYAHALHTVAVEKAAKAIRMQYQDKKILLSRQP